MCRSGSLAARYDSIYTTGAGAGIGSYGIPSLLRRLGRRASQKMPVPGAFFWIDMAELIAIAVIGGFVAITILIVMALERFRIWKLKSHFQVLQGLIDPGATVWPGPQIRGSFRGRELNGYRRNELIGFTLRGGTNGKTIIELSCGSPLQFMAFTFPLWPAMAELLHLGSPRVPVGDFQVDRSFGFASPDPDLFHTWMAQPDNRTALLSLLSTLPPSRRQRFRVRVEGGLQINMPEYLFFKMKQEQMKKLVEGLDSLAGKLENAGR